MRGDEDGTHDSWRTLAAALTAGGRERDYRRGRSTQASQRVTSATRAAAGNCSVSAPTQRSWPSSRAWHDAGDLAEVLAERMAGLRGWFAAPSPLHP